MEYGIWQMFCIGWIAGCMVMSLGYYQPERSKVWEAYDEYDCGFAHAHTLKEVRLLIDSELDK